MRVLAALLLLALLACAQSAPPSSPSTQPTASPSAPLPLPGSPPASATPPLSPTLAQATAPPVAGERATVRTVIDGDTLTVVTRGGQAVVRLIGIDAPERGRDGRPDECYFAEATALLAELTPPGTVVLLERDVSDTDRYGRLLRYIWIERNYTWILVNEELVRLGAARARDYPPDTRYSERLAAAQREARSRQHGLWGACDAPTPTLSPATPRQPVDRNCDPSYPDVCIPPPQPDLDCRDIPYRHFRVFPPDPHQFDSDRDGIGCESG